MVNKPLPLPAWIWHPNREARLKIRLHRRFELDMNIENPKLGIALTGGARVTVDGVEILNLPESPENVCRFNYARSIPLKPGKHHIQIEVECEKPVPNNPATSFVHDRTVGCMAWLEGDGFRLVTDETWSADDVPAIEICKLGQEPYGDPDYPPDDFARSGFGDLTVTPMPVTQIRKKNINFRQEKGVLILSGTIDSNVTIEPIKHSELVSIYHLRKQDDWKRLRKVQQEIDLSEVPSVLLDLQRESNARLRILNLGSAPVTILWNGAESLPELAHYDNCTTEVITVEPGEVSSSVPTGMRYLGIFVLGKQDTRFQLRVLCESIEPDLKQVGSFICDDDQLNLIYQTAVHTNYLCNQLALWDGIKRDRLPWVYDLYLAARGAYPLWDDYAILKRSLVELGNTPEGAWMNSIPDYTLWWFVSIWEYLMHRSDTDFVEELAPAIQRHADWVSRSVDEKGFLKVDQGFIDWVPITSEESRLALQAVYMIAKQSLSNISRSMSQLGLKFDWPVPEIPEEQFLNASPVAAKVLGILAGYVSREKALEFLNSYELADPVSPCSAYLLACLYADFNMPDKGLEIIRSLWGGMLENGATSFWEAVRCDYPEDFHKHLTTYRAYGEYRMSLCHAWSSTPVEWFSRILLGINPITPGYREVEVAIWAPENMNRCEGTVPTPFGPISVSWIRRKDGQIIAKTHVPEGVRIV